MTAGTVKAECFLWSVAGVWLITPTEDGRRHRSIFCGRRSLARTQVTGKDLGVPVRVICAGPAGAVEG